MARPLFCYGTLLRDDVWLRETSTTPDTPTIAMLKGYRRFDVPGRTYPGIFPDNPVTTAPDRDGVANVKGAIRQVDSEAVYRLLDRYEGAEYDRKIVDVETPHGLVSVETYVYRVDMALSFTDNASSFEGIAGARTLAVNFNGTRVGSAKLDASAPFRLCVLAIAVDTEVSGLGIGMRLVERARALAMRENRTFSLREGLNAGDF